MHYEQTTIQKCFAIETQTTHFTLFIQGDVNKYNLFSELFKTALFKYQFYNVVNQVGEGVKISCHDL